MKVVLPYYIEYAEGHIDIELGREVRGWNCDLKTSDMGHGAHLYRIPFNLLFYCNTRIDVHTG